MSEAVKRRIRAQASPRDPAVMRFMLDAPVQADTPAVAFDRPDTDAPLAQALFAVPGIARVQVDDATVTVQRAPDADWSALKAPVAAALRDVLDSTDSPLGAPADTAEASGDATLQAAVQEVLDRQANPAIAAHGGHVGVDRVENGTVYLRMSGGCQGCAASAATLRGGVEKMLRAALPGIRDIVDVTDHAAGTAPYYSGAPEAATAVPPFARPLPPGTVTWEDGVPTVDAVYLAGRLGLDDDSLRAGLRRGDVVSRSETGADDDAGKTRLVVRASNGRAWAAEIAADGSAHEVPPPRDVAEADRAERTLAQRVRAHLEALPPEVVPITYNDLARAMGLRWPGAIAKVTRALETTMREDSADGRPFIAARAAGKGNAGRPGRGFFDLARTLDRGPAPGESDAAFHDRQLEALRTAVAAAHATG